MDTVRDVPQPTIRERLEATFHPYKGADLPYILAMALAHMQATRDAGAFSEERMVAIYHAIFVQARDDFLGWSGAALRVAVFDHALDRDFGDVAYKMLIITGAKNTELWKMDKPGAAYDPAWVTSVFTRIEAMPRKVRAEIAIALTRKTLSMTQVYIHFARQVIRLCIGVDSPDAVLGVLETAPTGAFSMFEIVSLAGEAGSRNVFRLAVNLLQHDVEQGKKHPKTDPTLTLAKKLAADNNWT
jgi:hypothetical protein